MVEKEIKMSEEKHGVNETKEALIGLVALGGFVAKRLKDGADLGDLVALAQKLASDQEFVNKLKAAVEGMDKIDDELGELDMQDILELVQCIPDLLKELQESKSA